MVSGVIAQQLATLPDTAVLSVMNRLPDQVSTRVTTSMMNLLINIFQIVNTAMPTLFPRTKDDVKLSLILDSVPNLTKQLRN